MNTENADEVFDKARKKLFDLMKKQEEERRRKELFKDMGRMLGCNLMAMLAPPTEKRLTAIHKMVRGAIDQHLTESGIYPASVDYEVRVRAKDDENIEVEVFLPPDISDFTLSTFLTWDEKQKAPAE